MEVCVSLNLLQEDTPNEPVLGYYWTIIHLCSALSPAITDVVNISQLCS